MTPFAPRNVSKPFGSASRNPSAALASAAARTSASVVPGRPKRMFFQASTEKITGSCGANPMQRHNSVGSNTATSTPSTRGRDVSGAGGGNSLRSGGHSPGVARMRPRVFMIELLLYFNAPRPQPVVNTIEAVCDRSSGAMMLRSTPDLRSRPRPRAAPPPPVGGGGGTR